ARAEVGAGGGDAHPDGGSAERWTGHRSKTLLELRACRTAFDGHDGHDGHSMTYENPWGRRRRGWPAAYPAVSRPLSGPWRRRTTAAYAAGGSSTAYRRKVHWRHRAHRRRSMRVESPPCTHRRQLPQVNAPLRRPCTPVPPAPAPGGAPGRTESG